MKSDTLGSRDHLSIENGQLAVDGFSCQNLADEYGTPLYVLSEARIRQKLRNFHQALHKLYEGVLVCPAYKANCHLAVSRIYQTEGAGAEVVSAAELKIALDSGVEPEKIVYNGPLKKRNDLEFAISSGVGLINADSFRELDLLQDVAHQVKEACNVGIRINLGLKADTHPHLATALREHKFGIWMGDAIAAYTKAAKHPDLRVIGVHSHIGSNISQPQIFGEMASMILQLASQVKEKVGLNLTRIDLGGGVGFPYQPNSHAMTYQEYASAILAPNTNLLEQVGKPTLIFEPGRTIVADAGLLLTRVGVVKRQGDLNWAIVDAGMNTFLRPALYEAKHQVVTANRASQPGTVQYNLGGPCCESGDIIAKAILLPKLAENELLTVLDVGAYGFTMASNYNGEPRPAVVLVSKGESQLIRRRENYEDLTRQEVIPFHLRNSIHNRCL
jgi:diaminopimelate decarboxylase